jgi:hypothetical protein
MVFKKIRFEIRTASLSSFYKIVAIISFGTLAQLLIKYYILSILRIIVKLNE